jgi:transposase-like protein
MRKHYTNEERSELVDLVAGGGATVAEAAARLGVTTATAYGWLKRAGGRRARRGRAERLRGVARGRPPIPPPTFVRVLRASDLAATIKVRIGGAEIHVRRGFDVELLRAVAEALRGGAA